MPPDAYLPVGPFAGTLQHAPQFRSIRHRTCTSPDRLSDTGVDAGNITVRPGSVPTRTSWCAGSAGVLRPPVGSTAQYRGLQVSLPYRWLLPGGGLLCPHSGRGTQQRALPSGQAASWPRSHAQEQHGTASQGRVRGQAPRSGFTLLPVPGTLLA